LFDDGPAEEEFQKFEPEKQINHTEKPLRKQNHDLIDEIPVKEVNENKQMKSNRRETPKKKKISSSSIL